MALEAKGRFLIASVTLIDEEKGCVEHAGSYYMAKNIEFRLIRDDNQHMKNFCAKHGLCITPVRETHCG